MIYETTLAIRVERRRIALVAFSGLRLDFAAVRELPDNPVAAAISTRKYVLWALATLKPDAVAVETPHIRSGARRKHLWKLIHTILFARGIRRLVIRTSSVRQALGVPPLRSWREARQIASDLWPRLPGTRNPSAYDAALLGLHIQMIGLLLP